MDPADGGGTLQMRVVLCALFVCSFGTASAANWVIVAGTEWPPTEKTDLVVEVDASSIRWRDGFRQGWVRYTHQQPKPTAIYGKTALSQTGLMIFDCKNEESATLQSSEYAGRFGTGESVSSRKISREIAVKNMASEIPDSFGDGVLKYVCKAPLQRN